MKSESHGVGRKRSKRGGFVFSQGKKSRYVQALGRAWMRFLSRKLSVGAKALGGLWVRDRARESQFVLREARGQRSCAHIWSMCQLVLTWGRLEITMKVPCRQHEPKARAVLCSLCPTKRQELVSKMTAKHPCACTHKARGKMKAINHFYLIVWQHGTG